MTVTVLIDGNSVGYTEHYATKLRAGEMETQAIFGFLRKMRELKQHYAGCRLVVLWDGRAQWRFDLWPNYKSNRENDAKKIEIKKRYAEQRPYIAKALDFLGITQITVDDMEADDMAGYLSRKLTMKEGDLVVLYSGDRDWIQLVKEGVVWRDVRDMANLVKLDNFTAKTGYRTPIAFLEGKALQGDDSDTIPGIPKLGDMTAVEFVATWGSVKNFFAAVDNGSYQPKARKSSDAKSLHPEQALASAEGRKTFVRNMKLMNLINTPKPDPTKVRANPGKLNKEAFTKLCEDLAFFSIIKDMDNFISHFESK